MPGGKVEIEVVPDVKNFPRKLESGLKASAGIAGAAGKAIGLAVAGGIALGGVGIAKAIQLGNDYTASLNELQAVSGATGVQMKQVGDAARALGSDLSLPATSGADAAKVMLELAKGGLTLDESMQAARGTIQLAAAAQIEGAAAAEIQSGALNQFGLAADQASRVADVLANTSNAASGSITDIALALKYVGPIAASVGISIEDTSTAIGLLANNGIQADNAGTALRGMLASLAAPSKEAAGALTDLQIQAFDSQGKFVGLRTVIEQLTAAQGRMTDEQFTAAAATAFGREPLAAITALAASGTVEFDKMATAVGRQGGAADVAAAKTAGLGGAMDKLKSQAEDVGLGVYEAIAPHLERLVLAGAQFVSEFGDEFINGLDTTIAAAEVYGPRLAEALSSRGQVIGKAFEDVLGPLAEGAINPLNEGLNTSINLWDNFTGVLGNAVDAARPAAQGVGELAAASAEGSGAVNAFTTGISLAGDALEGASAILVPIGKLLGTLVSGFAELPGPVQTAVTALVALRIARSALGDTTAFSGIRQFSDEMRVQRSLAAANGEEISRLGSVMAAYHTSTVGAVEATRGFTDQTAAIRAGAAAAGQPIGTMSAAIGTLVERSPALSAMRQSFDDAAGGATRFGTAAGIAAGAGTGLRLAAGGLVSAMGGPFGLAIAGAAVGLSLLASRQQAAAQRAQEHESYVDGLSAALRESSGVINDNVRASAAKALQDAKVADSETKVAEAAKATGISLLDLTEAMLGNDRALDGIRSKLQAVIEANRVYSLDQSTSESYLNEHGEAAQNLLGEINKLAGGFGEADQKNRDLDEAIKSGKASMLDATDSGRSFAAAMAVLGDKTATADQRARGLKDALDALSGGSVNLEAAQSRVNEQLARLGDMFGENVDQTKGYGETLLNTNGSINTTTDNGRKLFDVLQDLSGSTAEVSQKTYDMAIAQGDTVPVAMSKATAAAQASRDAFIAQASKMGLSAEQAVILADRYGLIPADIATLIQAPGMDETQQELIVLKALADKIPPDKPIHVQSLSDEAQAKLEAVGLRVERIKDKKDVYIYADDGDFQSKVAAAIQPSRKSIFIDYYESGRPTGPGLGQPNAVLHDGGIIAAHGFANGGLAAAKPFRAGIGQVFPPRILRYTGDRIRDDEFYIPDDGSQRSIGLLHEAARRQGYALMRMFAQGGIQSGASAAPAAAGTGSLVGLTISGRLRTDGDGFMQLIDGRIEAANHRAGSAINRRKRV